MAEKQYRFDAMLGNERLKEQFSVLLREGRMSHAYLIEGAEGSGRRMLARLLAMALCCTDSVSAPCGTCQNCRRIASGNASDIKTVTFAPGRKTIGIDTIRAMRDDVNILPNDGEWKVYFIYPAEEMTEEAQNAFLKVLEEPPAGVVFFLICTDRTRLLTTILSRIQTCRTEVFDDAVLSDYLTSHIPAAETAKADDSVRFSRLLRLSDGSIGTAIRYLTEKDEILQKEPHYQARMLSYRLFELMSDTGASAAAKRISVLTALLNGVRTLPLAKELLEALLFGFDELAKYKKYPALPLRFFAESEIEALADAFTVRRCIETTSGLGACLIAGDANPNLNLYLTNICRVLTGFAASGKGNLS